MADKKEPNPTWFKDMQILNIQPHDIVIVRTGPMNRDTKENLRNAIRELVTKKPGCEKVDVVMIGDIDSIGVLRPEPVPSTE